MEKVYIKIISAALILCGCSENPISPDSEIGPIIFASNRDGKRQIYAMQEDGSNMTRITRSDFNNYRPRWSRDGKFIVFNSKRSANIHFEAIVMADANGSNEKVLLEHGVQPLFSPTGDKIAFSFDTVLPGFGSNYDIALYDLQTKSVALFKEDTSFSEIVTDWSSDGRYLLVDSYKGTTNRQLVINVDLIDMVDSSRVTLTDEQFSHFGRFSPDGQSIVYVHRNKESEGISPRNVYTMNNDGSAKKNVTNSDTIIALFPVWSRDGSKIIFINQQDLNQSGNLKYNIYSINTDGTGMVQLTDENDSVFALGLDWRW